MKLGTKLLTAAALAVGVAALLAASALAATSPSARLPHVQHVTLAITGSGMEEHVAPALGNIAIAAGVPVRVTVTNYTHEFHTFTILGLGVSALIHPATGTGPSTTTFTFTASRTGVFKWHCAFCASGTHGMPHDMGGTVYVVINPSALP
jgi:heme/copper-type cytochrome/quinol oxidase subunit 2